MAQVGRALFMSPSTVKTHIGKIYEKLGAHNRASAVIAAVRLGLVADNQEQSGAFRIALELVTTQSCLAVACHICEKSSVIRMAPGPMMTMKSAGKMQSSSGNRIFTVTFCACSSAR